MTTADEIRTEIVRLGEVATAVRDLITEAQTDLAAVEAEADGISVGDRYETPGGVAMVIVGIEPYPDTRTAYMAKVVKVRADGSPSNVAPSTEYRRTIVSAVEAHRCRGQ